MSELIAALAGAIVGAVIAALATWATTRWQWQLEVTERRRERLENEVELLLGEMASAWNKRSDMHDMVRLPHAAVRRTNTLEARARQLSPHLTSSLASISTSGSIFDGDDVLAHPWMVMSYMSVLDYWFADSKEFERLKPDVHASRARMVKHPSGWPEALRDGVPKEWSS